MADLVFDELLVGSDIYFDALDGPLGAAGAGVTVSASAPTGSGSAAGAASGAGVTDAAAAPAGTVFQTATLVDPIYTGPNSLTDLSTFIGMPKAGDTVRYDPVNGFVVFADGSLASNSNSGSVVVYYNDGSGEFQVTVNLDSSAYAAGEAGTAVAMAPEAIASVGQAGNASGAGVTDAASAPDASLYGGVNVSGAGKTDTATAPTGVATSGTIATGAGKTDAATAPTAGAAGGAAASGSGATADAVEPEGVAEIAVQVTGAGVTDAASAPQGSASGNVYAIGGGSEATATAPTAAAQGDRLPGTIPYSVLIVAIPRDLPLGRAA